MKSVRIRGKRQGRDSGDLFFFTRDGDRYFSTRRCIDKFASEVDQVARMAAQHYPFPGDTIVDVGACNGVSCMTAVARGYFEMAIAIEPDRYNFATLLAARWYNGLDRSVFACNVAVGAEPGIGRMKAVRNNVGGGNLILDAAGDVAVETLDEIAAHCDTIGLIWLDCQGSEAAVLEGAPRFLERSIPWFVEICIKCPRTKRLMELLAENFVKWVEVPGQAVRRPNVRPPRSVEKLPALLDEIRGRGEKTTNILIWR